MEILILIIGLFAFSDYNEFAPSALNTVVNNNIEKSDNKMQAINKPQAQFEITNKKGVWMFTPAVNKNQKKVIKETESSKFITLPDGSKIEQGL